MLEAEWGARGMRTVGLALTSFFTALPATANPVATPPATTPPATPAPSPTSPADTGKAPAAPQPNDATPVPSWSLRVALALGGPVVSDQEELLELEGYAGMRLNTSLAVARQVTDVLGLGGLVLYGWRSADAEVDEENENLTGVAPSYEETLIAFGAQAPLSFGIGSRRTAVFFVTPWAGVGFAKAEFGSGGAWQTGPAFGANTGMFFPKAYLGFAGGVYFVPLPAPGEAGGHNDLGMIHLSIILGADVG